MTPVFPLMLLLASAKAFLLDSKAARPAASTYAVKAALLLLACSSWAGCSKEAVNQPVYESMRHIRNEKDAENPNYDSERIGDYNRYQAIRDGQLEEER